MKFLESEARNLGDDVVNGGLEAGRRFAGDVVWNLIEGVADSEFGGNFRDRKPGRFGGEAELRLRGFISMTIMRPLSGFTENWMFEPPVSAHGANDGEARVAHDLVFLVRERLDGRDGDAVAGVHAHGIKVFDGANDHAVVGLVAHHLHLVFLPANERFLDEDFVHRRKIDTFFGQLLVLIAVANATAGAAEGVGGPDDEEIFRCDRRWPSRPCCGRYRPGRPGRSRALIP